MLSLPPHPPQEKRACFSFEVRVAVNGVEAIKLTVLRENESHSANRPFSEHGQGYKKAMACSLVRSAMFFASRGITGIPRRDRHLCSMFVSQWTDRTPKNDDDTATSDNIIDLITPTKAQEETPHLWEELTGLCIGESLSADEVVSRRVKEAEEKDEIIDLT